MDKFEKLVLAIMKETAEDGEPVTRAEAEEMAKMEMGSKEIRRYEQSDKPKERKPRERKIDEEKKRILSEVKILIEGMRAEDVTLKTETELSFKLGDNAYTLKLTKHRPKK